MPKNTIGGSGAKKSKNVIARPRELLFRQDCEDYAVVLQLLGSSRLKVLCLTTREEKIGIIRGNMRKKVWIAKDDIVLISNREFEGNKCDIVHKYDSDEIKLLIKYKEIKKDYMKNGIDNIETDDVLFDHNNNSSDNDNKNNNDINIDEI
jgi:translation initiation factor 1A